MVKTTNMGGGTGRRSDRDLKVRVKTSKGRKIGSTIWLQRQLNDPYVAKARAEGYRSRAAYKILELDERYKLFKRGQHIVDLGAAPGGWSRPEPKAARYQRLLQEQVLLPSQHYWLNLYNCWP